MSDTNYSLQSEKKTSILRLPDYDYHPAFPENYRPKIGLIGCGGITKQHLAAYRAVGLEVAALCDLNAEAAEKRRDEFYPEAEVYTSSAELLARPDIEVVDIALHADPRADVIEAALNAGKHALSQKPFVKDLDTGHRLVELARRKGLKLAVNQNGRWAPYVRWITLALRDGLIGEVQSVNININWDHSWVRGSAFEKMRHLILYDFAVHWLDMARLFLHGKSWQVVSANNAFAPQQEIRVPMMAAVLAGFDSGSAVLDFDGHSRFLESESLSIRGTEGTIEATGAVCSANHIEVENGGGRANLDLEGAWFPDAFGGTMGELLRAIEMDREPENGASDNLKSLELVFAAIESAGRGGSVRPGEATKLTEI